MSSSRGGGSSTCRTACWSCVSCVVILSEAKDLYVTPCKVQVLRSAQDDNTSSGLPADVPQLHEQATVLDDVDARPRELFRRLVVANAELQPQIGRAHV